MVTSVRKKQRTSSPCNSDSDEEVARATDAPRRPAESSTLFQRFKFMRQVYQGELPAADLEDLLSRAESFQEMCRQEPVLEPIGIQLMYGPWRAKLIECWAREASCVQRPVLSDKQRAQSIFQILVNVAQAVSKEGVPYWSRHAGWRDSWQAGGEMVLERLGVLIPQCDESAGLSFQGAPDESDDEERDMPSGKWKIAHSKQERDDAMQKLLCLIWAWWGWSGVFMHAPTQCTDWSNKMTVATWLLKQVPGPVPCLPVAGPADCTSVWTFRGVMLLRMQQEGVKKLKVDNIGLQTFCCMNPDEAEHMLQLIEECNIETVTDLVGWLHRHGVSRPELLSMELRLAGDPSLDELDVSHEYLNQWKQAKHDLRERHRMCPHIACIAEAVRQRCEAEG